MFLPQPPLHNGYFFSINPGSKFVFFFHNTPCIETNTSAYQRHYIPSPNRDSTNWIQKRKCLFFILNYGDELLTILKSTSSKLQLPDQELVQGTDIIQAIYRKSPEKRISSNICYIHQYSIIKKHIDPIYQPAFKPIYRASIDTPLNYVCSHQIIIISLEVNI